MSLCGVIATTPVWISASKPAVRLGADRDALLGHGAAADDAVHALARQHDAHRPARELRRRGRQDLVLPQALAAEAAADVGRGHADLLVLEPEHLGDRPRSCATTCEAS